MCGDGEELRAVLPVNPPLIDELQIGLVDQGGGWERVIRPLPLQVAPRQAAQFRVDGVDQTAPRRLVTLAPGDEEPGDVRPPLGHGLLYAKSTADETEFLALPRFLCRPAIPAVGGNREPSHAARPIGCPRPCRAMVGCGRRSSRPWVPLLRRPGRRNGRNTQRRHPRWACRLIPAASVRPVVEEGMQRSETIRRQCEELAAARAVVVLEWGDTGYSQSHAMTAMAVRDGVVVATCEAAAAWRHRRAHGARAAARDRADTRSRPARGGQPRRVRCLAGSRTGYETQAAVDVGRQVAAELRAYSKGD